MVKDLGDRTFMVSKIGFSVNCSHSFFCHTLHGKVLLCCLFFCLCFINHVCWSIRLCKSTWGHCSIYNRKLPAGFSYRRLYLQLDEGSLTFNANPQEVTHGFKISCLLDAHYLVASAVCLSVCVEQWHYYKNYVFGDVIILSYWRLSLSLHYQNVSLCV